LWCAALLLLAGVAGARPPPEVPDSPLNDRFSLQAGMILSGNTTALRYDPPAGGLGTDLAVEPDLGLAKRKMIGRGEVAFRIHDRHRVRLANYFVPLDRSAATVLGRQIVFGGSTYSRGDVVQSELSLRSLSLTYSYAFLRTERYELAGSLGCNLLGIEAAASVVARLRTERQDRTEPAPLAGFDATGRLGGRFWAEGRVQYLKVAVSGTQGSVRSFEADLLYRLHPNVTFGLGYTAFDLSVASNRAGSADRGRFELRSVGPQLFARVGL
jgi:hypothetical protein